MPDTLTTDRQRIPHYMKHARDAYLPLDPPKAPNYWDSRTPFIVAAFIAWGCVAFAVAALIRW